MRIEYAVFSDTERSVINSLLLNLKPVTFFSPTYAIYISVENQLP